MRLSQWRAGAPAREALGPKVSAVVEPVLAALGAEPDPHLWIAWGDDPAIRYTILAPTTIGLAVCHVRVYVPGDGPRASGKLVRWSRVQLGELGIETQSGHRLVSFQTEGQVLRGADAEADEIAAFAIRLFAGVDGRPLPEMPDTKPARRKRPATVPAPKKAPGAAAGARTSAARPPARAARPPAG